MRLAAGQTVGRYEVVDVLGQGGMSESYRARDRETGDLVVLKIPYASVLGDAAGYSRYEREMEIGRRLVHPNIQRILATGRLDDTVAPYIVAEYVEGELLRAYLDEHGPLEVDEAIQLAVQLAGALQACHEQGIVHRDLKPENVLITADHQIKLLDFGIALLQGARRVTWSRLSPTMGTPDYMAPEQIRGERGDVRTDVYALGVMLFEMLAGRVPFEGDSPLAVMNQHVNRETPRLRTLRRDAPPQIDAIIAKATRRDPHERYQSMAGFRHDLEHYSDIDLEAYQWVDLPPRPVGGFLPPLQNILLIAAVFAALIIIGVIAQLAHGAQVGH